MQILIAAIGRTRRGPEEDLYKHYSARLTRWPVSVRQVAAPGNRPLAERRIAEGELLLAAAGPDAATVALDEAGATMTSSQFAAMLSDWQADGQPATAFLIGGPDGHAEAVRQQADRMVSFGAMTWPHLLVRGLLAEQLYRAQQILAQHPYHRV